LGCGVRTDSGHDILHPSRWEVVGLGLLVGFYSLIFVVFGEAAYGYANFIGEAAFGGVLVAGAVRAVGIDPVAMWTGLFWIRLASAVYFGFGSAMKIFFNEYTTEFVDLYYWASPSDLLRVNFICAVGMFFFMGSLYAIGKLFPFATPFEIDRKSDPLLWLCGITFCVIGYSIRYMIILPNMFGLYGSVAASGILSNLTYLAVAGLFTLTLWCSKYSLRLILIPTALLCADMVTGTLLLSKGAVLFPLIVYILGLCRYRASFRRLAMATLTVVLVFNTLVPAVQFGRAELERRHGYIDSGDLEERLEILSTYFSFGAQADSPAGELSPLARFYYANAMAAAAAQYESGRPGRTLADAYTILIPRAIWPSKPVYDVGAQFNLSVVGDPNSSAWMGIFVEAFWNLGWIGLPSVMIPLAIAYAVLGRMVIVILKESKWLHFPVALFNVWMGMRVDADIVETQFVLFVGCIVMYWLANPVESLLFKLLRPPLGPGAISVVAISAPSLRAASERFRG
jgi:hypothetical protein